jgi:hypothetical protein
MISQSSGTLEDLGLGRDFVLLSSRFIVRFGLSFEPDFLGRLVGIGEVWGLLEGRFPLFFDFTPSLGTSLTRSPSC